MPITGPPAMDHTVTDKKWWHSCNLPGAGSKHVQVRTVTFIRPPQHFGCDEPNGACRQR